MFRVRGHSASGISRWLWRKAGAYDRKHAVPGGGVWLDARVQERFDVSDGGVTSDRTVLLGCAEELVHQACNVVVSGGDGVEVEAGAGERLGQAEAGVTLGGHLGEEAEE